LVIPLRHWIEKRSHFERHSISLHCFDQFAEQHFWLIPPDPFGAFNSAKVKADYQECENG
jgi:hypothetical protein